jgi:hypothetical protein
MVEGSAAHRFCWKGVDLVAFICQVDAVNGLVVGDVSCVAIHRDPRPASRDKAASTTSRDQQAEKYQHNCDYEGFGFHHIVYSLIFLRLSYRLLMAQDHNRLH